MAFTDVYARQERKVPTWLSAIIIVVIVIFVSFIFFRNEPPPSKATKKVVKRVEITNISSSQMSVFWQTEQPEQGWIAYGTSENNIDKIALDDRDFQSTREPRRIHYAILRSLNPSTKYYFKLVNENELISNPQGRPFSFVTLPKSSQVSNLKPAYGKITDANGAPLDNVIVILSVKDAYLLSSLSKSSGEWLIPLNYILNKKTSSFMALSKDEKIQLDFFGENGKHSLVQTSLSNLSPVSQSIMLGKNYNLNQSENVLSATDDKNVKAEILYPKEKAVIPGTSPLIRGTAMPNTNVSISISNNGKNVTASSKVGGNGSWSVNLPSPLSIGNHSMTVETTGTDGKEQTLARNFSIAKSGEQVLGEATGSATPTLAPTDTPAPTSTASSTLTPTPPVSGASPLILVFSSLCLITMGLWLLAFSL